MTTLLGLLMGWGLEILFLAFPAWLRNNNFKKLGNNFVLGGRIFFTNNTPEKRTKTQNIILNSLHGVTILCAMYLSGVISYEFTTGESFVQEEEDFGKEFFKDLSVNTAMAVVVGVLGIELGTLDTLLVSDKGVLFPGTIKPFRWKDILAIEFDADKGQSLYGINIRLKNKKVEKIWLPKSAISRTRELLENILGKLETDIKLLYK